jgi:hypothetical protein
MTRLRSALRYALPLAALLAVTTVATMVAPTVARADWEQLGSWSGSDSTTYTVYQDDDGKFAVYVDKGSTANVYFSNDLAWFVMFKQGFKWSDPGPEDNGKGTDKPDVVSMLKKVKGFTINVPQMPEKTPLGKWLDSGGAGFVPHWNPGDDDGKGPGRTPGNNVTGPTAKQLAAAARIRNEDVRELNAIGGSMGDVGDLSGESAPGLPSDKNSGSSGRGSGGNGNGSDNNSGKRKYLGTDESLGPRPDLVNPPHKTAKIGSRIAKTGNKGAKLSVLTPGLLDGGATFSGNGPSATSAIGHSASRGAAALR